MVEQVTSGIPNLDQILCGGLPRNSVTMLIGEPGAGKTILAQSFMYANCRNGARGLYLTTAAEPLDKNIRYVQEFSFFRPEAVQEDILYEDLSHFMMEGGFQAALERIEELLREHQPDFLVMDSFRSFTTFATNREDFHRLLHQLASMIGIHAVTALWVGEYAAGDLSRGPEFAIVDGVIELKLRASGMKDLRYLRVAKMRGSDFVSGEHAFRVTSDGLAVYPRLTTPPAPPAYTPQYEHEPTGVGALDALLPDGVVKGSNTVLFGPAGSGKTLLGLEFIFAGIERGRRGLIVNFQENPTQLQRKAELFGRPWQTAVEEGSLLLQYTSSMDMYVDEIIERLVRSVEDHGVERVLIDSVTDFARATPDESRFHDFLYALTQRLSRLGASTVMTHDLPDLFPVNLKTRYGISYMSDTVVLLHYIRRMEAIERAIAVLKSRGGVHDVAVHFFAIDRSGSRLGESTPLGPLGGVPPSLNGGSA